MEWLSLGIALAVAALFLIQLLFRPHRSRVISFADDGGMRVATDESGNVIMMHLGDRRGDSRVYEMLRERFFPYQMFAVGILTGVCGAILAARLFGIGHSREATAFWMVGWILLFAAVAGGLYLGERSHVARLRRRGVFDELVEDGADPIRVAAALHFWTHRFKLMGIVALAVGATLIALGQDHLVALATFLVAVSGAFYLHSRQEHFQWVSPRDLERAVMPAHQHLLDGAFVMPLGLLALAVSFGILPMLREGSTLPLFVTATVVSLAIWSVGVSRSSQAQHALGEWRTVFRDRITRGPVAMPVVEPRAS
jgi:hypothetical protein